MNTKIAVNKNITKAFLLVAIVVSISLFKGCSQSPVIENDNDRKNRFFMRNNISEHSERAVRQRDEIVIFLTNEKNLQSSIKFKSEG